MKKICQQGFFVENSTDEAVRTAKINIEDLLYVMIVT